jgi:hypothetical protein
VIKAETPVLSSEEACKLLDSIERYTLIGPGDGALIVTMVYSFARVSAAVTMKAGNYSRPGALKMSALVVIHGSWQRPCKNR